MNDTRNVVDEFKAKSEEDIIAVLDSRGVELEIAIENVERDFNMGSIVRTANGFGVRHVHVIGRRQWNKRGAMATDKYLHVHYHESAAVFSQAMKRRQRSILIVDNVEGAKDITRTKLPLASVLVFGSEGSGVSAELMSVADDIVAIHQSGSTRSLNVAAAAAIAMYEWVRQRTI